MICGSIIGGLDGMLVLIVMEILIRVCLVGIWGFRIMLDGNWFIVFDFYLNVLIGS